ncbi:MAG: hypothetical protein ACI8RD_012001, partial [Bacillariaceae sp.]
NFPQNKSLREERRHIYIYNNNADIIADRQSLPLCLRLELQLLHKVFECG